MAKCRLSRLAESDLIEIGAYTLNRWGESQTLQYLDLIEKACERLATKPDLGRFCDLIRSGLRRMECGRHFLFYRIDAKGIVILRILHQRMLPLEHSLDANDPET